VKQKKEIVVYGYGNPGRQDDGLGPACIRLIENWLSQHPEINVQTDCNYQLNIEDAEVISTRKLAIFVDATMAEMESFSFERVNPSNAKVEFTMHAVSPAFVLDLCQKIYDSSPETWLLSIKGYEWDFGEQLSYTALKNLNTAYDFLKGFLLKKHHEYIEQNVNLIQ